MQDVNNLQTGESVDYKDETVYIHSPSIPVTHPPFVFVSLQEVMETHYVPFVVHEDDIYLH